MAQTDTFLQAEKDKLFYNLLLFSMIATGLITSAQLFLEGAFDVGSSEAFFLSAIISYILFVCNQKQLAKHVMIMGSCSLLLVVMIVLGKRYEAVLFMYPAALVYCFLFFNRLWTHVFYFLFLIASQMSIVYIEMIENGWHSDIVIRWVSLIILNIIIYILCYFFISNINKMRARLEAASVDIRQQKLQLQEQSSRLEDYILSNKKLENYTHLASHELKAPLRSVSGFAEYLKRKINPKLDDSELELFDFIIDNTKKMNVLLDDLRELGNVTNSTITSEKIDFHALIEEIKTDRRHEIKARNAVIELDCDVEKIDGQRSLIKQLFSNLIGNAIKFVEEGKEPKISIIVKYESNTYYFEIHDNGIGIPLENRSRIFQIFTRLNPEIEFKGSGIGLTICKKVVDLHNGAITVKDSKYGGTCFIIDLPVAKD